MYINCVIVFVINIKQILHKFLYKHGYLVYLKPYPVNIKWGMNSSVSVQNIQDISKIKNSQMKIIGPQC